MEIYNKYHKGSEWRKWDLHVHTPYSYINDFPSWENYIEKLKKKALQHEISVVGITDYFSVDGYEKILEQCEAESRDSSPYIKLSNNNKLFIFPVIELRLDNFTSDNSAVNVHVIFSPHLLPATIKNNFLENLEVRYGGTTLKCKDSDLIKIGYAESNNGNYNGNLNIEMLSEAQKQGFRKKALTCITFSASNFEEKLEKFEKDIISSGIKRSYFLIAIANKGHGSLSGFNWTDIQNNISRAGLIRQNLLWHSDICFSNHESDKKFLLGQIENTPPKEVIERFKSLKPCIWGSDAHDIENLFYPSNGATQDYTWIKADTTFEGLKQIIFEPEERVRIQKNNPQLDFRKANFKEIILSSNSPIITDKKIKYSNNKIELNSNLVAIIGGRGTGKSLLIDTFANIFKKYKKGDRAELINNELNFKIKFAKADDEVLEYIVGGRNDLDYLHVHQSEIKNVVEYPEILDTEIKKMLSITETTFSESTDLITDSMLEKTFDLYNWLNYKDENGNNINSIEHNKNIKEQNENLISTITNQEYKAKIENFIRNNENISRQKSIIEDLNNLRDELLNIKLDKNDIIAKLNLNVIGNEIIPSLDFSSQIHAIELRISNLNNSIEILISDNVNIKTELITVGIQEDISSLFDKIDIYNNAINVANKKIEEIISKKNEYDNLIKKRESLFSLLISSIKNMKANINSEWNRLKNGKEGWTTKQIELLNSLLIDIDIKATIQFDVDKFYESIYPCLNWNKFKATNEETSKDRIRNTINVKNLFSYISLLKNKKVIRINEDKVSLEEFLKLNYFNKDKEIEFLRVLFLAHNRNYYLKVRANIRYKGKPPDEISVGQRGTMFICLKLATDPFVVPFIYDQPEDDLDNNFIMKELVPMFKKIKKYRQVIIVTHNANLVVNADADQVIVANNNNEILEYVSGSLEHSMKPVANESNILLSQGIKEHICDILEGGRVAFESREKKYGF